MTTAELLVVLQQRRVQLEAADGRLRYRGPKGALTPELRAAVVVHKSTLLALVARPVPTSAAAIEAVAELLVAGEALGWPRLEVAPHLTLLAGEANWFKFLEFPPPDALQAALAVAKERVEDELPI